MPPLTSGTTEVKELASCARVDVKPIDRDKQIKYDIAKNEAGPLTRTRVIEDSPSDFVNVPSTSAMESTSHSSTAPSPLILQPSASLEKPLPRPHKKRRLTDEDSVNVPDAAGQISFKGKGKAKEEPSASTIARSGQCDVENANIPEALLASTEERVMNLEEHLSIRYGEF